MTNGTKRHPMRLALCLAAASLLTGCSTPDVPGDPVDIWVENSDNNDLRFLIKVDGVTIHEGNLRPGKEVLAVDESTDVVYDGRYEIKMIARGDPYGISAKVFRVHLATTGVWFEFQGDHTWRYI